MGHVGVFKLMMESSQQDRLQSPVPVITFVIFEECNLELFHGF